MVLDFNHFSTIQNCVFKAVLSHLPTRVKTLPHNFFSLGSQEIFMAKQEPRVLNAGHDTTPLKLRQHRHFLSRKHFTVRSWFPRAVISFESKLICTLPRGSTATHRHPRSELRRSQGLGCPGPADKLHLREPGRGLPPLRGPASGAWKVLDRATREVTASFHQPEVNRLQEFHNF